MAIEPNSVWQGPHQRYRVLYQGQFNTTQLLPGGKFLTPVVIFHPVKCPGAVMVQTLDDFYAQHQMVGKEVLAQEQAAPQDPPQTQTAQ